MLREIISQKKPKTLNSYDVGEKKEGKKGYKGIIEMGENQLFQERMEKLVKVGGGQENNVEEC